MPPDHKGYPYENWHITPHYCLKCSNQTVWTHAKNQYNDDFYLKEQYICVSCSYYFYVPVLEEINTRKDKSRVEFILSQVKDPRTLDSSA